MFKSKHSLSSVLRAFEHLKASQSLVGGSHWLPADCVCLFCLASSSAGWLQFSAGLSDVGCLGVLTRRPAERWWLLGLSQVHAVTAVCPTVWCRHGVRSLVMSVDNQCFPPLFLRRTKWFHTHSVTFLERLKIFCGTGVIPLLFVLTFNKPRAIVSWLASLRL